MAPRVSIVLAVRNAAHLLPAALAALQNQTFQDFEVVVVDGRSTDGTLDLLTEAARSLPIKLVSEPDDGISDAYAKGFRRAIGDLVIASSADERLAPEALAIANRWFAEAPDAMVCCGRTDLIDGSGNVSRGYANMKFDLASHLSCEVVLPISASIFNRSRLGPDLRLEITRPTCPDYELWGRLAFSHPSDAFKLFDVCIATALATRDSMSFRTESFDAFVRDKAFHLNNLLKRFAPETERARLGKRSLAGIHMWAAEQLFALDPNHADLLKHCAEALSNAPDYKRIADFLHRSGIGEIDGKTGALTAFPKNPGPGAVRLADPPHIVVESYWSGAQLQDGKPLVLITADQSWGYSAVVNPPAEVPANATLWLQLDLEVESGSIGVGRLSGTELRGERLLNASQGRSKLRIPFVDGDRDTVIIRNGAGRNARVRIHDSCFLLDSAPAPVRDKPFLRRLWDKARF